MANQSPAVAKAMAGLLPRPPKRSEGGSPMHAIFGSGA